MLGKSRHSSAPTWPLFPVSRIRDFMPPSIVAAVRQAPSPGGGIGSPSVRERDPRCPSLYQERDRSRLCRAHPPGHKRRCTYRESAQNRKEPGIHVRILAEYKSRCGIFLKERRSPTYQNEVSPAGCLLQHPALLPQPRGTVWPAAGAIGNGGHAKHPCKNGSGCPEQSVLKFQGPQNWLRGSSQ